MTAQDWRSLTRIASQVNEEEKRRLLLDGIYSVVENWQGPLPDLLEIFRPEKIEYLLSYAVTDQDGDEEARIRFIKFVVDTGYRDQPELGPDGRYLLGRTTPIHLVWRAKINNWDATGIKMVHFLFEIYNRFDLNYIDETEFTHFHAACSVPNGHKLVVKFLKHGQNPNLKIQGYSLLRSGLHNNREWTAELLRRGADPTRVDADGSTALHTICRYGRVDLLELVVAVQINVTDKKGNTPLHLAILHGHKKTTEILLTNGADPNLANGKGSTPLHIMCQKTEGYKLVEIFFNIVYDIGKSVQVNVQDKKGDTPLHLALENSNTWLSKILLERGADPNLANGAGSTPLHVICRRTEGSDLVEIFFKIIYDIGKPVQVNVQDKRGNTPLHLAILHGHKKATEILLKIGADVNLVNEEGSTPLHTICRHGGDDLLKLFFEIVDVIGKPVQVNVPDNKGDTPLHLALENSNTWLSKILLERGANPNSANAEGSTPLHLALENSNTWAFNILLERGADLNSANAEGSTPLHIMCQKTEGYKLVEIFFKTVNDMGKPVQVNVQDKQGNTPLHLAIHHKSTKKTEILLVNGANPNLADKDGCTALHLICNTIPNREMRQFFDIIDENKLTLQIDAQNNEGWTPLHMALNSGSKKKIEMLLERDADPNVTNKNGWNALHFICRRTRDDLIWNFFNIIGDMPVHYDAQDDKGQTPLFVALFVKNTQAAGVLLEKGADPNLANNDGWTPLHIMCIECNWFLETFFEITDKRWTRVEINAKTNEGRTPLNLLRDRMPINYQKASQYLERRGAKLY